MFTYTSTHQLLRKQLSFDLEGKNTLPSLEAGLSALLGSVCERRGQRGEEWHSSGRAWRTALGSPNLPPVEVCMVVVT